jgi:hypothetical protein
MKVDMCVFFENLSRKFKVFLKTFKNKSTLYEDPASYTMGTGSFPGVKAAGA